VRTARWVGLLGLVAAGASAACAGPPLVRVSDTAPEQSVLPTAVPEPGVKLVGKWHVLIHYTDAASAHPDWIHWQDRLWIFEKEGAHLRWTDYPIVLFSQGNGRFEQDAGGLRRTLGPWQPDADQLAELRQGIRYNPRGGKTKTLRGSDVEGWKSGAGGATTSVSLITYSEIWSVDAARKYPVFLRRDEMGSERAQSLLGVTAYRTEFVAADGASLRGVYQRDEDRRGTFWLRRVGGALPVEGRAEHLVD